MITTGRPPVHRVELPLSLYPGMNPFVLDLLAGKAKATDLCNRESSPAAAGPPPDRAALAEALIQSNAQWENEVSAQVTAWQNGEAVAVIGGQQTGFAGGPLLTLTKAASLISVCRSLESEGTRAVPFFWMATEDHDWNEVATLDFPLPDRVETIRSRRSFTSSRPVGPLPIPEELIRELLTVAKMERPRWLREGVSFGRSFAELLAGVVQGKGLVLVDSLLPQLRAAGAELLGRIVSSLDELDTALAERSAEIERRGYAAQIRPTEEGGFTLLYLLNDSGERLPLRKGDQGWTAGRTGYTAERLEQLVRLHPENVSTAAATRPLLQDEVFRPAVFVGGPAELAYYAQVSVLHAKLGVPQPRVALRGHLLVAPERVLGAMDRYGISATELLDPPEKVLERRETERVAELERELQRISEMVEKESAEVRRMISDADPTMKRPLGRSMRRIRYHLAKLGERGRRAITRRDDERHAAVHRLSRTLFPGGVPQDRRICWISLWLKYGPALFDHVIEEIQPDSDRFRITGV